MKLLWLIPLLFLLLGCRSTQSITKPVTDFFTGPDIAEEDMSPTEEAAHRMTRYGVSFIALGTVFGAFSKFRTGWGLSLAAAGVLMILLAWTFDQAWAPWVGLSTIVAYGFYKYQNRINPKVETEHPLS